MPYATAETGHYYNFRGGNAPASLKRVALFCSGKGLCAISGVERPGLIEARFPRQSNPAPVSFPGWKRPGLIEAIQSV